jgi:hypothetical protein
MITLTRDHLFVVDEDMKEPYRRRRDEDKTSVAWGQRKLFLTELAFMNMFWDPTTIPNPIVVYAGAAPGTHIPFLLELYPEISELHLYDPRDFASSLKSNPKIHVYQEYFTDETAKHWSNNKNVLFISDIRTADYTVAESLDQNEEQIMQDLIMQETWYKLMQPAQAMLKFRLPYPGGTRPNTMQYLNGHVMRQPWAPQTSTETRLIPFKREEIKSKTWNCKDYEEQMFYLNCIVRETFKFDCCNGLNNQAELTDDFDSAVEIYIWRNYLLKRGTADEQITPQQIQILSELLTTKLNEGKSQKDTLKYLRSNPRAIKERNFARTNSNGRGRGRGRGNNKNSRNNGNGNGRGYRR